MRRLLARLLELICPAIQAGEQLPYGLSRGKSDRTSPQTDMFRVLVPLLAWRGVKYLPHLDCRRRGWWVFTGMLALIRVPGGIDIRVRGASWPRGNGELQAWHGNVDAQWYDEQAFEHGRYVAREK